VIPDVVNVVMTGTANPPITNFFTNDRRLSPTASTIGSSVTSTQFSWKVLELLDVVVVVVVVVVGAAVGVTTELPTAGEPPGVRPPQPLTRAPATRAAPTQDVIRMGRSSDAGVMDR
jgi:hypothetical protein